MNFTTTSKCDVFLPVHTVRPDQIIFGMAGRLRFELDGGGTVLEICLLVIVAIARYRVITSVFAEWNDPLLRKVD